MATVSQCWPRVWPVPVGLSSAGIPGQHLGGLCHLFIQTSSKRAERSFSGQAVPSESLIHLLLEMV